MIGLIGVVVGGVITASAAWLQTRVSTSHELKLFREGLEADRQASRTAIRRAAALEVLRALGVLDAAMPHMDYRFAFLGGQAPGYVWDRRNRAKAAMDELRRAQIVAAPLLGDDFGYRWQVLLEEAEAATRVDIDSPESAAQGEVLAARAQEVYDVAIALITSE